MRIFDKFNKSGKCPICGTNEDKPCILIAISGTEHGNIAQAETIHIDCIDLRFKTLDGRSIIGQSFVRKDQ